MKLVKTILVFVVLLCSVVVLYKWVSVCVSVDWGEGIVLYVFGCFVVSTCVTAIIAPVITWRME